MRHNTQNVGSVVIAKATAENKMRRKRRKRQYFLTLSLSALLLQSENPDGIICTCYYITRKLIFLLDILVGLWPFLAWFWGEAVFSMGEMEQGAIGQEQLCTETHSTMEEEEEEDSYSG